MDIQDIDNYQNLDNNGKKPKDRRHKFLKNRDKYQDVIANWNIKDSPIQDGLVYDREKTDANWGYCFMVFFALWVGIIIYAFIAGDFAAFELAADDAEKGAGKVKISPSVYQTLYNILISLLFCVVLALIYIGIMAKFTKLLCYMSIAFIETFFIVLMAFPILKLGLTDGLYFSAAPGVMFLILNCQLYCFWSKMEVAIAVIGVAADFYAETKRMIFVSSVYFTIHMMVSILTGMALILLFVIFDKHPSGGLKFLMFTLFFIYTWIGFVIHNIIGYTASVGASTYYFSSNAETNGSAEIMIGHKWSTTKNFGSLALGALVMTLIKVLRMLVPGTEEDSICSKCCGCIQALVDYIDELALAYMSVSGDKFFTSAWNGFLCNLKHMMEFYFAQDVGAFFIFIGKLVTTSLTLVVFYLLEKYNGGSMNPLGFVGVGAAALGICFITLGLFMDAIICSLMCLAIDMDLNDGTPQFGNPKFHAKLDAINGSGSDSYAAVGEGCMDEPARLAACEEM